MDWTVAAANTAWLLGNLPRSRRFCHALLRPHHAQQEILQRYLRQNSDTAFGRRHGFAQIRSPSEYQQRVPLCDYEAYRPYVAQIAAGEQHVLTHAPSFTSPFPAGRPALKSGFLTPRHCSTNSAAPLRPGSRTCSTPTQRFAEGPPTGPSHRSALARKPPPESPSASTKTPPISAACSRNSSMPPSRRPANCATSRTCRPSVT